MATVVVSVFTDDNFISEIAEEIRKAVDEIEFDPTGRGYNGIIEKEAETRASIEVLDVELNDGEHYGIQFDCKINATMDVERSTYDYPGYQEMTDANVHIFPKTVTLYHNIGEDDPSEDYDEILPTPDEINMLENALNNYIDSELHSW